MKLHLDTATEKATQIFGADQEVVPHTRRNNYIKVQRYLGDILSGEYQKSGDYSKKSDEISQWSKGQTIRRTIEGFKIAIPGVQT